MLKKIIKRDGRIEDFAPEKLNVWSQWAGKDLGDRINWSEVVLNTVKVAGETISSQDLQRLLIKQCVVHKKWGYSIMAGRLFNAIYRKELYDGQIPTVKELHERLAKNKFMAKLNYSRDDYAQVEQMIDHSRDFNMAYFQVKQIRQKYALQNRVAKEEFETPQFVFMRMAMALAEDEKTDRLLHVKNWYDHFSLGRINAPTPNYVNLGTEHNGYSSCCLYTTDDTARSLAIGDHIAYTMTYMSSGIGGYIGCRSLGDPVRAGFTVHQGKLPYFASLGKAVKANLQGGRGGACTTYYTCFDPEVKTITMLQNPRTPEDKKNRDIHFAIMTNRLFAKKVARNEDIFVFNRFTCPELHELFFSDKQDLFEEKYNQYEKNPLFKKEYISAREICIQFMTQGHEVATLYELSIDEANRHTAYKEPIYSSNLCVAGNTKILTDKGWFYIADLENEEVNVWNGEKFSKTTVRMTNETAKMIKVITDSGHELECTPYHKFYIQENYHGPHTEIRAKDLEPGMKLIKFDLPVIEGEQTLNQAYINGFFTGDGCDTPQGQRIYLYGEKMKLAEHFEGGTHWVEQPNQNRMYKHYKDLYWKYFVPDTRYTVQSRLDWLAGLSDSDGCIYRNSENQQLVISSVKHEFLKETLLMLQTLGVSAKIRQTAKYGDRLMPVNDKSGNLGYFSCEDCYRLIITSVDLQKLMDLGIQFNRLKVVKHQPQRDAKQFVKILDVDHCGRYDTTYCFTEPERNMGMFNGILTGNCLEILQPTAPYEHMSDLYRAESVSQIHFKTGKGDDFIFPHTRLMSRVDGSDIHAGQINIDDKIVIHGEHHTVKEIVSNKHEPEVSLCSLGGIVITNINNDDEYASAAYYNLKMIDKCIHKSHYELPHVGFTAKSRLNAGVGILGLAYHLARLNLKYDTQEGLEEIHRVSERHAYFMISASLKLGKELGNAPWMWKTKWPEGWLPIDTYKKSVDQLVNIPYQYDWEELRQDIIANRGIRNSSLISDPPTESSSKASGAPNSVYPIRDLSLKKTDADNVLDWCAPDNDLIEDQYQLAWEIPFKKMVHVYAVIQKFTDQGISADFYKDRSKSLELNTEELITDYLEKVKYGVKTKYYQNSYTPVANKLNEISEDTGISLEAIDLEQQTQNERGCSGGSCTL